MSEGHWSDRLVRLRACGEALAWARTVETPEQAWASCPQGDWLLWIAGRSPGVTRQQVVLAACACARLALPYVREGDARPLTAIETAEAWARGEATLSQVRAASAAAASAAYADADYTAAAASAADAAAAYAAAAAAHAAAAAAGTQMRIRCADAVRAIIPMPEINDNE